jgi:hypothetical protein
MRQLALTVYNTLDHIGAELMCRGRASLDGFVNPAHIESGCFRTVCAFKRTCLCEAATETIFMRSLAKKMCPVWLQPHGGCGAPAPVRTTV